ncbi:hypothetical protein AMECASPLE_008839 [Ameca splendens]|uniref:Uncharacterized protein n=1 Tax=Ameca splendens TaxID=208324 RepID=A0ABV0Z8V2_9TELE
MIGTSLYLFNYHNSICYDIIDIEKLQIKETFSDALVRAIHLVAHFDAQLNRRRSSDVTGSINRLRYRVSAPFPPVPGQRIGGAFLERQELAGELLLHKAIPRRA